MRRFIEQLLNFFRNLNPRQRWVIIVAAAAVVLLLIFSVFYTRKQQYVPLYTGLSAQQLQRIAHQLNIWKESYRLRDNTILVPRDAQDQLRFRLAEAELAPEGGIVGFELFDKTRLTLTDFERRVNYRRALEGELSRAIESLHQVYKARVFISMPKKELYTEEEIPKTAAVRVHLKPEAILKPHQIKGIVNLVAYAVEGLDPKHVTIVDQYGNLLSEKIDNPDGNPSFAAQKQLRIQHHEAQLLRKTIKDFLSKVIGPDKVEVTVTWEMNFDEVQRRSERYTMPGFEQLKVSEEQQIEEYRGEGMVPGGAPGVEAQMPEYKAAQAVGPMQYKKQHSRINYLADKEEEVYRKAPSLSKVAVAVFVDGTYEYDIYGRLKRDKEGKVIYHPRTKEEMQKIEDIVRAAIGEMKGKEYKDREYIVKVENVQFERVHEWALELHEQRLLRKQRILVYSLACLAVAVILILTLVLLLRPRRPPIELPVPGEVRGPPEEEVLSPLEEAKRIAIQQPEVVADLVRSWVAEEAE